MKINDKYLFRPSTINFATDDYYGGTYNKSTGSVPTGSYKAINVSDKHQLVDRSFTYNPSDKRTGGSEVEGEMIDDCRTNRSKIVLGASTPRTNAMRMTKGQSQKAVYKLKALLR